MENKKIYTQKINPCLWFDNQAEEAVNMYLGIFKNSKINHIARYSEVGAKASGMSKGEVMTISFELEGQTFLGLNGGPVFQFSPAVSFVVNCEVQEEIDYFWEKLSDGGVQEQCGWLKDKFGVSWQIVPSELGSLMTDTIKSEKVMNALLKMKKLDILQLKQAGEE